MLAAWEAFKLFFSSAKNIVVVIFVLLILALAGYGLLRIYDAGKASQLTTDQKTFKVDADQIGKLQTKVANLENTNKGLLQTISTDDGLITTWKDTATKAQSDFTTLQNTTLKTLRNQLIDSTKRLKAAQQLAASLQENNPYVSQISDAQCVIPTGVVSLYNGAIEDPIATGIFGINVPVPTGLGYGAPSGISLSQFSSVFVLDLSAAVQRGDQVRQWQSWYLQTKANWDKVIKTIHQAEPTLVQPNPPMAANDPVTAPPVRPQASTHIGG